QPPCPAHAGNGQNDRRGTDHAHAAGRHPDQRSARWHRGRTGRCRSAEGRQDRRRGSRRVRDRTAHRRGGGEIRRHSQSRAHAAYCRRDGGIERPRQPGRRGEGHGRAGGDGMRGVRLSPAEVPALIKDALVRSRTSEPNAASVASALVEAELAGQSGHGLRRVAAYAAQARAGKVDGFAIPSVEKPRPAVLAVDAANGFAFPALDLAFEPLSECARTQGIALAGFRRSHHCGVAGVIVERYARAGLVALMFANSPAAMAPWGSNRPLFGTNPIAFAAPLGGKDPVVVDVSLSRVARGKIMAAAQKGTPIPEDWAFDAAGRPTTDPKAALAGTMAPLGDAKGTALALMVELLSAGLTGANYAY